MTKKTFLPFAGLLLSALFCVIPAGYSAKDAPMPLEIQLIWGTNDEKSPDPKHKEIEPALAKKLRKTPYKWKNYFEVNRQKTTVASGSAQKVAMSRECDLEIKNLGDERIEVKLFGNKKLVSRNVEPLPASQTLIIGGDAKNETAWLIVITRSDEKEKK